MAIPTLKEALARVNANVLNDEWLVLLHAAKRELARQEAPPPVEEDPWDRGRETALRDAADILRAMLTKVLPQLRMGAREGVPGLARSMCEELLIALGDDFSA